MVAEHEKSSGWRFWRHGLWILIVWSALLLLGLWMIWVLYATQVVRWQVQRQLSGLGFTVVELQVDHLGLGTAQLSAISLSEGRLQAALIRVSFDHTSLAAGRLRTIEIDGLRWRVRLHDGLWDLGLPLQLLEGDAATSKTQMPFDVLQVRDSQIMLDVQGYEVVIPVALTMMPAPDQTMRVHGRLGLPGLPLRVDGSIDPGTGTWSASLRPRDGGPWMFRTRHGEDGPVQSMHVTGAADNRMDWVMNAKAEGGVEHQVRWHWQSRQQSYGWGLLAWLDHWQMHGEMRITHDGGQRSAEVTAAGQINMWHWETQWQAAHDKALVVAGTLQMNHGFRQFSASMGFEHNEQGHKRSDVQAKLLGASVLLEAAVQAQMRPDDGLALQGAASLDTQACYMSSAFAFEQHGEAGQLTLEQTAVTLGQYRWAMEQSTVQWQVDPHGRWPQTLHLRGREAALWDGEKQLLHVPGWQLPVGLALDEPQLSTWHLRVYALEAPLDLLSVTSDLAINHGRLQGTVAGQWGGDSGLQFAGHVDHDLMRGGHGQTQIDASATMTEVAGLLRSLGVLEDVVADGQMQAELMLDVDPLPRFSGVLTASSVDLVSNHLDVAVKDLNGAMHFKSLFPPSSPPGQHFRIASIRLGTLELVDGWAMLRLESPQELLVERTVWQWPGGGQFLVRSFRYNPAHRLALEVFVEDWDLIGYLQQATAGRIEGSGRVYGRVAVGYHNGAIDIVPGSYLNGAPGGGTVAIKDPGVRRLMLGQLAQALQFQDQASLVAQRLDEASQDMRYDFLTVRMVQRDPEGLACRVEIRGKGQEGARQEIGSWVINLNNIEMFINQALLTPMNREDLIDQLLKSLLP